MRYNTVVHVVVALFACRFWDSKRNWTTVHELELLLQSSADAVEILECTAMAPEQELIAYAHALSRHANGCFKAACVYRDTPAKQNAFLDLADSRIATAVRLLEPLGPTFGLGGAMLVGGVTTSVRCHSYDRPDHPQAMAHALASIDMFYRAEHVLRPVNHKLNIAPLFPKWRQTSDLRRTFHPTTSGNGCQKRLEHRITCLNPIVFMIDLSGRPSGCTTSCRSLPTATLARRLSTRSGK